MALEAALQRMYARLLALEEACASLRTTVREDKPIDGDVVLIDLFGDAADDILGWLEGGLNAVYEAEQAATSPCDLRRVGQSLLASQEHVQQAVRHFSDDLARYERIEELLDFGRTRRGEWRAWTIGVKQALDGCQEPIFDVMEALLACWQELAECACATTFSVQTTTIGHHVLLARGMQHDEAASIAPSKHGA